jgi:hypothetical protein
MERFCVCIRRPLIIGRRQTWIAIKYGTKDTCADKMKVFSRTGFWSDLIRSSDRVLSYLGSD